ncbi:DNA-processing protein DprA [Candidatus Poribacteria bacterium]|nr:DNA-processing protein DprA [Candidatus Poribacteria bacterium]
MSHSTETDEKRHREYLFALASIEGIGAVRLKRLLTRFDSVERIFDAELVEIAQLPNFNPILASRILTVRNKFTELRQKLDELGNQGIKVLFPEDVEYPTLLNSVPDAPTVLCKVGKLSEVDEQCVAIVGSKRPTAEGINVTLELSIRLVEAGFTIVSGLANGIDTNAHYGALGVNGTTIGVISTDLSSIYPPENRDLAMKIYETGCIFSEHPFPTSPTPANLVLRNRIISGLSKATVVVETSKEGGAMHTARYAQLQDRPLFACQWDSHNQHSEGTRQLIRTGALSFLPDQLDNVIDILMHPERLQNHIIGTSIEQMGLFEHQES